MPSVLSVSYAPPRAEQRPLSELRWRRVAPLLVAVLLIALWARAPFIAAGLPYFYDEDEAHHFNRTVQMVQQGRYNPEYFLKPSLHFYLRMPVVALSFLWNVREGHLRSLREIRTTHPHGIAGYAFTASHPGVVKWNRAFSVGLSVLTVALTFVVAMVALHSLTAGVIAGLVTALLPPLVEGSAVVGVDVLVTTMAITSALLALLLSQRFSWGLLLACGLAAGLTVSSKYNAAPIALLPLLALSLCTHRGWGAYLTAIVLPAVGFLIGTPYALASLPLFLDHVAYEIWHYGVAGHEGHSAEPGLPQALFYLRWLWSEALGSLTLVAGALGAVVLLRRSPRMALVLLAFPLLFALLMVNQKANFTRNMHVVLPFLAVCAAASTLWVAALPGMLVRRGALAVVVVALVAAPLLGTLEARREALALTDTRNEISSLVSPAELAQGFIAVAGQLQLTGPFGERSVLFDERTASPRDLYLAGFDEVISSATWALTHAATLEERGRLQGVDSAQRVLQNPTLVRSALRPLPRETLFDSAASPQTVVVGADGCDTAAPYLEQQGAQCWIASRAALVELSNSNELSVMSPWAPQTITFSRNEKTHTVHIPVGAQGTWIRVQLPTELEGTGALQVTASVVDAPARHGANDTRRLAFALRPQPLQ